MEDEHAEISDDKRNDKEKVKKRKKDVQKLEINKKDI